MSPKKPRLDIAKMRIEEEISPLSVLLTVMRKRYTSSDEEGAVAIATIAAPYVHPKLAASEVKVDAEVTQKIISPEPTTEEWLSRFAPKEQQPVEHDGADDVGGDA